MSIPDRQLSLKASIKDTVDDMLMARIESGGSVWLTIASQSMYPALLPGDRVLVGAARPKELRLGDLVVVNAANFRIVHRLVARSIQAGDLRLITKGDNCDEGDNPWLAGQLLGVVVAVERQVGKLDLRSARARSAGAIVALLSRGQWLGHRRLRGKPQWAMCRLFGIALQGIGVLATRPLSP